MRYFALAALFALAGPAAAQNRAAAPLTIELKNGTAEEAETRAQLLGLLEKFDVTPWLFTTSVLIDPAETPHSHPVLTLNTRYSEHALLATFLHEQMHWRVDERNDERAIAAMAEVFEARPTFEWRGLGEVPASALRIRERFRGYDAEARYGIVYRPVADPKGCECGPILRGAKAPSECRLFGTICTPENPVGACMVSSEGSCAAWYSYGRFREGARAA